tara:strand:- start:331 stop:996 length:666 start_codon:yes stop_codon:yes gene_type:complete
MKKYLESMPESLEDKITKIFGETVAKEGNKFTKALMAARDNGKKFFSVNGKEFKTEDYAKEDNTNDKSDDGEGMDKVQPKAVKKKFKDRKDKDIDNDGDVDSSDKFLHKRRKAISKAVNKEEVANEVVETIAKKNLSMREALSQVWNNGYDKLKNNNPFEQFGANTPTSNQGVKTVARDKAAPKMGNASGPNRSNPNKKPINSSKTETGKPITKIEVNPKV